MARKQTHDWDDLKEVVDQDPLQDSKQDTAEKRLIGIKKLLRRIYDFIVSLLK